MRSRIVVPRGPCREPDAPKAVPPVTKAYLEQTALHYLERYNASTAMLRQTLQRRVALRCRRRDADPGAFAVWIDETVERAVQAGLVDDTRFAATRAATLRRRGVSAKGLAAKLAAKGIGRDLVAAALAVERAAAEATEEGDIEARAANAYAKRRHLGPWRRPDLRVSYRDRDLASLVRAGFAYELARTIVGGGGAGLEEASS